MNERLQARADALGAQRASAMLDAVASADLPPGVSTERDGDQVILTGRGLARRLAFDARLAAIGLIARGS